MEKRIKSKWEINYFALICLIIGIAVIIIFGIAAINATIARNG